MRPFSLVTNSAPGAMVVYEAEYRDNRGRVLVRTKAEREAAKSNENV